MLTVLMAAALLLQLSAEAGNVSLSFLREEAALQQTLKLLTDSGCSLRASTAFGEAVRRYNLCTSDLDCNRFPAPKGGFYNFAAVRDITAALPKRLCETEHSYDLNCFDAVLLVAGERLHSTLAPNKISGPFMVENITTNGEAFALAATPRDAFALIYPSWYQEETAELFPDSLHDLRLCFTPAFARCYVLPTSIHGVALSAEVLKVLRSYWQRDGIEFPKPFEIVLLHKADLSRHLCNTVHSGLLFHRGKEYTYLEKAGGKGPFVRLDLGDRGDLLPWLEADFTVDERLDAEILATFNDTGVEKLNSK